MKTATDKYFVFDMPGAAFTDTEISVNAGGPIDLVFKLKNISTLTINFKLSTDEEEDGRDVAIAAGDWGGITMEPIGDAVQWKGNGEVMIEPPNPQNEFRFTIKNFVPFDKAGNSAILAFASDEQLLPSLKISIIKDDAPFINSFEADRYFADQHTPVTLRWQATNVTKYTLYRNDNEIPVPGPGGSYKIDHLSASSTYTLKGINERSPERAPTVKDLYLTAYENTKIKVAAQQFPVNSRILGLYPDTANDALYALVQEENDEEATLYKATNDILHRWRPEYMVTGIWAAGQSAIQPATFPLEIATRPGLIFGGQLWLIGGSSYDSDVCGNTHGYIDLTTKQWIEKGIITNNREPMLQRMGHACVLHNGKIWVMGGHNPDHIHALKDIWTYDGANWERSSHELPAGRCMMGACNRIFNRVEDPQDSTKYTQDEQVWLFGGYEDIPGGKRSFEFYCMNKAGGFGRIQPTMQGDHQIRDYKAVAMVANEEGDVYVFANDIYHLYFDDKWYLDFRSGNESGDTDWHYNVKGHCLQTTTFLKSIWINSVHFPKGEVYKKKRGRLFYGYFVA